MRASSLLIIFGMGLLLVGVTARYAPWLVSWFGRLPGDIRYESGRSRVYFPIVSMLLVSLVVTVIIHMVRALRR